MLIATAMGAAVFVIVEVTKALTNAVVSRRKRATASP